MFLVFIYCTLYQIDYFRSLRAKYVLVRALEYIDDNPQIKFLYHGLINYKDTKATFRHLKRIDYDSCLYQS